LANLASSKPRDAIRKRVASWLVGGLQAVEQVPEPPGRAHIGDRLAALGDPRFDPERFFLPADEMLGFVHVPADPDFRIGTRKADAKRVTAIIGSDVSDREINDVLTPTPEFYIGRYPVTVAQFRAFVEDVGFKLGDANALRDPNSRPVRCVSWEDVIAYRSWLHDKLITSSALDCSPIAKLVRERGWHVALPSELEWEKAARGGLTDAVFPWGDTPDRNRANYRDTGIGDTSAVGCFPANGFGLFDMIGNLWEGTQSCYESYPSRAGDGREGLEVSNQSNQFRGGSWFDDRGYARCAYRFTPTIGSRYRLGLRVLLRSPPAG
jgi:formylglycine-generating enzyme required for sulfatase activity